MKDFGRYVERHIDFPSAEALFKSIKTYKFQITTSQEINELYGHAQKVRGVNCVYADA